uniref:RNA polymerase, sigma-24 subunit, ECF subfamily n=1 Tax=Sphingobacterium sp. (strain 21) TaxID=743722 RepID=F4CEI9_SPHS2
MGRKPGHSDAELFRQLVDQPEKALEAIYDRYGGLLRAYLRNFIRNDDDLIKDVVSEALVVVWKKREEAAEKNKPLEWMMRVAHNIALYRIREETKRGTEPLDGYIWLAGGSHADGELEGRELDRLIRQAAETLTPKERMVFLLIKMDGMTNRELMKRHNMAEQTVKNLLAQALKKIRKSLKDVLGAIFI